MDKFVVFKKFVQFAEDTLSGIQDCCMDRFDGAMHVIGSLDGKRVEITLKIDRSEEKQNGD